MAFLLFATALFAQDFSWDPDNGFVVISSDPEQAEDAFDETENFTENYTEPATNETITDQYFEDTPKYEIEEVEEIEEAEETQEIEETEESEETDEAEEVEETEEPDESEETDEAEKSEETDEAEEPEKYEYEALALIRYKNTETISFKLKVSYIPKPYILGVSLAAGFTEYKLIQPFYFGGFLEPHVGIPQKAFPYKYELGGTALKGPLIIGGKLYAPFGICVFPFQENIEFFVELAPGISLNMMWDAKFGKDSITSKLYPAFYGALRTGATYKGFTFFIEGNYDAILGFGVSAGIGYSLNFTLSSTPNNTPSSLEDK